MSYFKYAMSAVGALALFAGVQQANAVTLQQLIDNGTPVISGNVVYSNFSAPGTLPASSINVNFTTTGVQFTANWNTLTPGHDMADVDYDISVGQGGGTITGSTLDIRGFGVTGTGFVDVAESLKDTTPASAQTAYSLLVNENVPDVADVDTASVTFNPEVTSLHINKSIEVGTGTQPIGAFAALNFVENTYVSNPNGGGSGPPVPEPMSLALLPLALVGLGLRKKLAR